MEKTTDKLTTKNKAASIKALCFTSRSNGTVEINLVKDVKIISYTVEEQKNLASL